MSNGQGIVPGLKLTLGYPGVGIRTLLVDGITPLERFGFFRGSYFKWDLCLEQLEDHAFWHPNAHYLGFAADWRELVYRVRWTQVRLLPRITVAEYCSRVGQYRQSDEYRDVDLRLLARFCEVDVGITEHCISYMKWQSEVETFILERQRAGDLVFTE